jgi:antitoxin component of MazEF toxin-antitoxin module
MLEQQGIEAGDHVELQSYPNQFITVQATKKETEAQADLKTIK